MVLDTDTIIAHGCFPYGLTPPIWQRTIQLVNKFAEPAAAYRLRTPVS
jgi:hypothetical protein